MLCLKWNQFLNTLGIRLTELDVNLFGGGGRAGGQQSRVSRLSPQSPALPRPVGNLDLQPDVPDPRNVLTTDPSQTVSSHEKKQQPLAKFITPADVEGIGADALSHQHIVVDLAQSFESPVELVPERQPENPFTRCTAVRCLFREPVSAFEVDPHRAKDFGDFYREEKPRGWRIRITRIQLELGIR